MVIIFLAFIVRLYKIDNPVADWHSWRQADTSAVTRNFTKFSFDLLHPRYDDLSNIASGKDNLQGYRFVEFPIYNALTFSLDKIFTQLSFSVEIWGRLVSIFASLASIYFLYSICNQLLNTEIALLSAFFFSFLPFNIFYSRTILPESFMVACTLAMIWFFMKWLSADSPGVGLPAPSKVEGDSPGVDAVTHSEVTPPTVAPQSGDSSDGVTKRVSYLLALFFASVALLLKPFAGFLFIPLIYLIWKKDGFKGFLKPLIVLFFSCSVIPFILWRFWIVRFPEGIPAWRWLLNGDGIRFKGAFFYWLFGERLTKLILGYWGLPLLFLGLLVKSKKKSVFFYWWGLAMLFYVSIIATGNVKHDYYQIITIPIICVFLAKGTYFLLSEGKKIFNSVFCSLFFVLCLLFMFAFSWHEVRTFYWVNKPEIIEAGHVADRILPKNAKVIAPYGGDTAFLYQINRQGWPIGFEIEEKIRKGATYYVSVSPEDPEAKELAGEYKVLEKTERYIIIELAKE